MEDQTRDRRDFVANTYATVALLAACLSSVLLPPYILRSHAEPVAAAPAARAAEPAVDLFCAVGVRAPQPFLRCDAPAVNFQKLRRAVEAGAGFDFLASCGDMLRDKHARASKPGVAENSRHKTGQAFDYNQEDGRVLIVREQADGRTYWRTYLRCARQDGTCGVKLDLLTDNAGRVAAYLFDFTAAAEALGWERIPAQDGWERSWTKREFWHYEMSDGAEALVEAFEQEGTRAARQVAAAPSPLLAPLRYLAEALTPRAHGR